MSDFELLISELDVLEKIGRVKSIPIVEQKAILCKRILRGMQETQEFNMKIMRRFSGLE